MTAITGPALPGRRAARVIAVENLAHAGFVSRFIAFVIDLVVLAIAISASHWFIASVDATLRPLARFDLGAVLIATIPLIVIGYFVGMWRISGQTVGKWLLGLRVISTSGGKITVGKGLLRFASYLLSAAPLYAGFLWIVFDPQRRALHDRLARTLVVYDPAYPPTGTDTER